MRTARTAARALRLVCATAPWTVAGFLAATLTTAVLPALTAWLTKLVLDGISGSMSPARLAGLAGALATVGLCAAALPAVNRYLRAELDRSVRLVAKDRLYMSVQRFAGLARFEDPPFLDRLRLAEQSAATPANLVDAALTIVQAVVTLTTLVGSLFVVSPAMTVVLLAAALPALLAERALARRRAAVRWRMGPTERRELFYSRLLSSVEAAKEIRLFHLGSFLRGRMTAEARTVNAAHRRVDRREAVAHSGLGLLAALVAGGGLVWAIQAAGRGRLSVGDVSMFVAAVAGTQGALGALVNRSALAHQELLHFEHYLSVLDAGPDLPPPRQPRAVPPLRTGIELHDVWFRYSDDHDWVLRGVDLRIPYGQAVGLVGRNGAGKSTLVKLLCRFYDPTRGAILWDGVDLRDVPVDELRRHLSGVFQDYMHYELSAFENIAVGDLAAADQSRVRAAAEQADLDREISALPRGYATLLSRVFFDGDDLDGTDRGVSLSGGQWQRLALARSFLRDDRDLMILDEPSAGLDPHAEYEIHRRLRQHRTGRTSLLISHRLSAIRDADLIAVLADGVVAESGSHGALMAAGGRYADLFTRQATGYRESVVAGGNS
jgi:ATP-binding cassette subfamily B protein